MEKIPSIDEFIEKCDGHLSKKDFGLLKTAVIDDLEPKTVENKILYLWYVWERNLRNKLVQLRAKRKNIDPKEFKRENPSELVQLLEKHHWNKSKVAKELGIGRTTLWRMLKNLPNEN